MTSLPAPAASATPARRPPIDPWKATLGFVGVVTALRVALLFATPLELHPDEAQYWLWSRHLAFGYFSKPPMIAWLIYATTAGSNGEAWVRLSAPLAHGLAALALQRAGARFRDGRTGFWAAAIYLLMPGVQLSSLIVATDAPLLAFLAAALWALGAMWTTPTQEGARKGAEGGARAAAAFGLALGLATLSKYAAMYDVLGLAAHALLDRQGRDRLWRGERLAWAAAAFAVVVAPNLAWNALHHFQTLAHTAANADLDTSPAARGFDPRGAGGFLLGQFAVFGPAPLAALAAGAVAAAVRRRVDRVEALLLCLTAPPLAIVLGEAVASRANANWAAAAYVAGSLLAAGWLGQPRRRAWLWGGLGVQAAAWFAFAALIASPPLANAAGLANTLKRVRGWRASAELVRQDLARAQAAGPVSALAVDDHFLFNTLAYYGRGWIDAPGAPPLRSWVHEARPRNQAEAEAPLRVGQGARVAVVSMTWPRPVQWDFSRVSDLRDQSVRLDATRTRDYLSFVGEGFAPRPRDPRTGLPVPPPGVDPREAGRGAGERR